jgi:hypothetical protein
MAAISCRGPVAVASGASNGEEAIKEVPLHDAGNQTVPPVTNLMVEATVA